MISAAKLAFRLSKFAYWTPQKRFRTLGSFTLFSTLPIELRVIIWTLALPGPNILELNQCISSEVQEITSPFWEVGPHNPKSPVLLLTNHEAREVALRLYQAFQHGSGERIRTSYMDPRIDILVYKPAPWTSSSGLEELSKLVPNLEKLAVINFNIWEVCQEDLRLLNKLKELLVVGSRTHITDGPLGYKTFKDMSQQDWDEHVSFGGMRERRYGSILQIGSILRDHERGAAILGNEVWVAPKLRIGKFVS